MTFRSIPELLHSPILFAFTKHLFQYHSKISFFIILDGIESYEESFDLQPCQELIVKKFRDEREGKTLVKL
jgi:hypothetical protein